MARDQDTTPIKQTQDKKIKSKSRKQISSRDKHRIRSQAATPKSSSTTKIDLDF